MFIRPVGDSDLDDIEKFAYTAGSGLVNLPKNRKILQDKIQNSLVAFTKNVDSPASEDYLFVIEELATGTLEGTCAISARTGVLLPDYYFRIATEVIRSEHPAAIKERKLLIPASQSNGPSEIKSLFLCPTFRKGGFGRLLSLSRFLFIAEFPHRFTTEIVALMRAYFDQKDHSPLWDSLGRHFFDMEYEELLTLPGQGKEFMTEIMPTFPIYLDLIAKKGQKVIGKIHPNTIPAFKMLMEEGFILTDEIDALDGGPKMIADTSNIRTITESIKASIKEITQDEITSEDYLISNCKLDYRACFGKLILCEGGDVAIPESIAQALKVNVGEYVRFVLPKKSNL